MAKAYHRRKYLINRQVQFKYALLVMATLLLYTLFLMGAILWSIDNPPSGAIVTLAEKAASSHVLLELHTHIWPAVTVVILLFAALSIVVTHKVVGPLFSIDRTIRQIAGGDLTARARIRDGDDLREFHENFNVMATNLENLLADLEQGCRKGEAHCSALGKELSVGEADTRELTRLVEKMKADQNEFCQVLQRFTFRSSK
ncbi:MAG: methyl-accepting chemotaxis protein [Proteobacteria bacterium]|nr:methyl-accepting chemotaxis protein [Pseudomonadota bacterium]MBU1687139.1 methyl-accepting chemotaxis protein [Pseudomonadota bacterium]